MDWPTALVIIVAISCAVAVLTKYIPAKNPDMEKQLALTELRLEQATKNLEQSEKGKIDNYSCYREMRDKYLASVDEREKRVTKLFEVLGEAPDKLQGVKELAGIIRGEKPAFEKEPK